MSLTHPSPNHSPRAHRVEALCVHWTGGSYASALDWTRRRESQVSYHAIIAPSGELATCVPWDRSAWSVGVSQQPDDLRFTFGTKGNGATENIALAGGPPVPPTPAQIQTLVWLLRARMVAHQWPETDGWRIVGHVDLAMPRGRKTDPTGHRWLDLDAVRRAVAA